MNNQYYVPDASIGVVYGLMCPTTNVIRYIGQTIQVPHMRLYQHKTLSIKNNNHLGAWLRKLRRNNILDSLTITILEECSVSAINSCELKWIGYYDNKEHRLCNSMKAHIGRGHFRHSDHSKAKIGIKTKEIHTGMKRSPEVRAAISKMAKERYIKNPSLVEDAKKRFKAMREAGVLVSGQNKKQVYQFNMDGMLIAKHESLNDAAMAIKCPIANISACCLGKQKSCRNSLWSFLSNPPTYDNRNKRQVQATMANGEINNFNTVKEAAKATGVDLTYVYDSLNSGRAAKGIYFKRLSFKRKKSRTSKKATIQQIGMK